MAVPSLTALQRAERGDQARQARASPAKHWCFTINNPEGGLPIPTSLVEKVQYLVCQLERGESGTEHYQGYVQLKDKARMSLLKGYWPTAHLEVARGSPAQCRNYCTKEDTRVEGPWEIGSMSGGKGSRTDLHALGAAIVSGKKIREIALESPEQLIRYSRGIQALEAVVSRVAAEGEERDPYVYVLWGAPGTGKTLLPHSLYRESDIYTFHLITGGHQWFDGYDGQPVLIIDDFTGWVPFRTLLTWLDRYPLRLEVKGSTTYARWHRVFITSNLPPDQWYHERDLEPLSRRVSFVWHFPEDSEIARSVTQGTLYTP